MKQNLIDSFVMKNGECFEPFQLTSIKEELEKVTDDKAPIILGLSFQKPTIILIISILLGWDRFFLDDIGLGLIKVLTCNGCLIWWVIDIVSAKRRTYEYNLKKIQDTLLLLK